MQLDENQISIKAEINGRDYFLICDKLSPLGEIHDVLCIYKNHIIQSMKNVDKPEEKKEEIDVIV